MHAWNTFSTASLAQLAEHALRKRMVAGSIPAGGSSQTLPPIHVKRSIPHPHPRPKRICLAEIIVLSKIGNAFRWLLCACFVVGVLACACSASLSSCALCLCCVFVCLLRGIVCLWVPPPFSEVWHVFVLWRSMRIFKRDTQRGCPANVVVGSVWAKPAP